MRSIDLRYGMKNKILLPMHKNFWASVEFHYRIVLFWIFWVFLQKFQKLKKSQKKPKWYGTWILPRFGNFQALVEFHYLNIPFRIFQGQNEKARWMVEILQVLKFYKILPRRRPRNKFKHCIVRPWWHKTLWLDVPRYISIKNNWSELFQSN